MVLDEESFQQLLAAAYVLQQHNSQLSAAEVKPDRAQTLARIVETQTLLQSGKLNVAAANQLIAEQAQKITGAAGAIIGLVKEDQMAYEAGSGTASEDVGLRVPLDSCLSAYSVANAEIVQCADVEKDFRLRTDLCRARQVRALIAVPVYREGKVAGVLELRFAEANAFEEHDVRTAQIMAGLVTDAVGRATEREWKQLLAAERATMLDALEKIKPQLERLAEPAPKPEAKTEASPIATAVCSCGNPLADDESFCGLCGSPRTREEASTDVQNTRASMWPLQPAGTDGSFESAQPFGSGESGDGFTPLPAELQEIVARFASEAEFGDEPVAASMPGPVPASLGAGASLRIVPSEGVPEEIAAPSPWTSATRARNWLESLQPRSARRIWLAKQWQAHRANIYLGSAVVLLIVVLTGWGSHSASNAGKGRLTLFEKALVTMGLAEAPPAPVYQGNPTTQVWVDVHTALYYCSDADLYGKTADGKFATQRDAQQDQFEPASRKACP